MRKLAFIIKTLSLSAGYDLNLYSEHKKCSDILQEWVLNTHKKTKISYTYMPASSFRVTAPKLVQIHFFRLLSVQMLQLLVYWDPIESISDVCQAIHNRSRTFKKYDNPWTPVSMCSFALSGGYLRICCALWLDNSKNSAVIQRGARYVNILCQL